MALCKYNVFRSEYWNGTLEGNSCSRLLDHLDDIPFPASSVCFINALKTLKQVKDKCLGMVRKSGWQDSIRAFREAWRDTGLPWSLKSHILSDHYEEYLTRFENDANAGAALVQSKAGKCYIPDCKRYGIFDSRLWLKIHYFLNVLLIVW